MKGMRLFDSPTLAQASIITVTYSLTQKVMIAKSAMKTKRSG